MTRYWMALALMWPVAAQADCLTARDLGSGIKAEFADGSATEYWHGAAGLVSVLERPDPARPDGIAFVSRLGLYDLEAAEIAGGETLPDRHLFMAYSEAVDALPEPRAGASWQGETTTTYPDGYSDVAQTRYQFGAARTVPVGGCTYEAIPVKADFVWKDGWMRQEFLYFGALGIGIIVASQYSSEAEPARFSLAALSRITP